MAVEYRITLDDEHAFNYKIELDRDQLSAVQQSTPHEWTRLEYQRCVNCPLRSEQHEYCPAAVDLQAVVEDFSGLPAFKKKPGCMCVRRSANTASWLIWKRVCAHCWALLWLLQPALF